MAFHPDSALLAVARASRVVDIFDLSALPMPSAGDLMEGLTGDSVSSGPLRAPHRHRPPPQFSGVRPTPSIPSTGPYRPCWQQMGTPPTELTVGSPHVTCTEAALSGYRAIHEARLVPVLPTPGAMAHSWRHTCARARGM